MNFKVEKGKEFGHQTRIQDSSTASDEKTKKISTRKRKHCNMSWHETYPDCMSDDDDLLSLDWMPSRNSNHGPPPIVMAPPSNEEMQERRTFREDIEKQTLENRRVHPHGGMAETGRNIVSVLRDRETYGAQHSILRPSPKSKPRRTMTYPLTVSREVQIFAEYFSINKFQASYLHHLGGRRQDEAEDEQQQDRPASTAAVSTISIAFAPDSQTMASTHGDHTVKITGNIFDIE